MGISFDDWMNRIAVRSDLCGRLTHLTKPNPIPTSKMDFDQLNLLAVDNLIKILKDKEINGSNGSGYIIGNKNAVCFQEAPLYALIQNVEFERKLYEKSSFNKIRYCGVGLSFIKPFIYFESSGRPVIYEKSEVAKSMLSREEYWRIVNLNYNLINREDNAWDIVDWTHEREWRVPGNLQFEYLNTHIVLYNPRCVTYFIENCPKNILNEICGITTLTSVLM